MPVERWVLINCLYYSALTFFVEEAEDLKRELQSEDRDMVSFITLLMLHNNPVMSSRSGTPRY